MSYELIESGREGTIFQTGKTKIYRTGLNEPMKGDSDERKY
jgi:hypothetical protein